MYKTLISIMTIAFLTGCGGGSSGSTNSNTTPQDQTSQTQTPTEITPMQLHLTSLDSEQVVLSWEQVPTATHYALYWSEGTDTEYYDSLTAEGITYTHTVPGEGTYSYYVIAMLDDKEITLPSQTLVVKVTVQDEESGSSDVAP